MADTVLVSMPYAPLEKPSIGLSLLKSSLAQSHISTKIIYCNLAFAEAIGLKPYHAMAKYPTEYNVIEWLFAHIAFKDYDFTLDDVFIKKLEHFQVSIPMIKKARAKVSDFLHRQVERVLAEDPKIVGCTSLFSQNCASLALLRLLKDARPDLITLIGGANVEGSMGLILHQKCPYLDYVFMGEGDIIVPQVLAKLLAGHPHESTNGILSPFDRQTDYRHSHIMSHRVPDFQAVSLPDYDDYFEQLHDAPLHQAITPCLLLETSRGCWWGEKKAPCRFCSLNGHSNYYRIKEATATLDEIHTQTSKYHIHQYQLVDNVLGRDHLLHLIPQLMEKQDEGLSFVYEVKTHLSKQELMSLASAGISWVQAGIENLHDAILNNLNKGTTCVRNIRFLRDGLDCGINIIWNYLLGVPLTKDAYYKDVLDILPLIEHLQPPFPTFIRYDRFSDYFLRPEIYDLDLKPHWTYAYIYPFTDVEINSFAYFFENHGSKTLAPTLQPCINALLGWNNAFFKNYAMRMTTESTPVLQYTLYDNEMHIEDTRHCRKKDHHVLKGFEKDAYLLCLQGFNSLSLKKELLKTFPLTDTVLEHWLSHMVAQQLILFHEDTFLSLAVNKNRPPLPPPSTFPGGSVIIAPERSYINLFKE